MFNFKDMTIGKKVGLGFGLITLILMAVVLLTIQQVRTMEIITKRVVELRTPTAHASLMMLNGINHSLASLRGWILLGDKKFKNRKLSNIITSEEDKFWKFILFPFRVK